MAPDPDALALLTTAEMGEADRLAIAGGIPGTDLMAAAGAALVAALEDRGWNRGPVAVLCGPGNNGGDGFVAARLLAEQGCDVRLALLGSRDALKGDAAHHAGLWQGAVQPLGPEVLTGCDLVIDALFGAGLTRPLAGAARETVAALPGTGARICTVDVPSGLSGDSGAPLGETVVQADLTVTFFRRKPGHLLLPGRELCGQVVVTGIGIPHRVLAEIAPQTHENGPALWLPRYPWRRAASHKYHFGHALVNAGPRLTGAAVLASRAALRVGAGLVTVACSPETLPIFAVANPSVMTLPVTQPADFTGQLADPRITAVLLGPGNGLTAATRDRTLAALGAGRSCVLDADALTLFQDRPADLFQAIQGACLLTPHEGEFARLFPDMADSKLARTRAAARQSGAVLLLKGADTVIAAPDGRAVINTNAPPDLAVAGAGDILAGLAVGLLAQGLPAFDAACAAAWLQGECAAALGPGLVAEDLASALPKVLRALRDISGKPLN